jgi:hypothetical protein
MNNCQGCHALDHPANPSAINTAPANVVRPIPNLRCIAGSDAITTALNRKWNVIALDISEMDHPRDVCKVCKKTEGP